MRGEHTLMKSAVPAGDLGRRRSAPDDRSGVGGHAPQQPRSRALLLALLLVLVAHCAAPPPSPAPPQLSPSSAALDCVAEAKLVDLPQRTHAAACAHRCSALEPHDWYSATLARYADRALQLLAPMLVVWMLLYAARLAATSAPLQRSFGHPCRKAGSRALRMLLLALLPLGSYSQACTYIAATGSSYPMWNCSTVGTTQLTTNCSGCLHQVLVVAGGGGGAAAGSLVYSAGGGGAGGFLTGSFIGIGTFTVVVGAGGSGGTLSIAGPSDGYVGKDSSITGTLLTLSASGGGKGAGGGTAGGPGGSGGGAGGDYSGLPASGISGQGYNGSLGWLNTTYGFYTGGGGGGAGGAGDCGRCVNATSQSCSLTQVAVAGCANANSAPSGGNGGNGKTWTYTGLAEYAGGGGGSAALGGATSTAPKGGVCLLGGGGAGATATGCNTAVGFDATKFGGGGGAAARGPGVGCGSSVGGDGYQGIVLIAVLPVRTSHSRLLCSLRLHSRSWHAATASVSAAVAS